MDIDQVARCLKPHARELRQLGVESLRVFGSVARDEAGPASDVDFLVEFQGPTTFRRFMGLKLLLEDVLGRPVDLATPKMLRERTRASILREAVRVA
jgi:predicted nucleotidyltransferase